MIIQIIGLPGSGKTTLAKALMECTDAIHLNADEVRADLNKDLGFTSEDREKEPISFRRVREQIFHLLQIQQSLLS